MNPILPTTTLQRLGLAGNPFRVLTDEELIASFITLPGRPQAGSIEFFTGLKQPFIEIIGEMGQGKTTLLLAWAAALRERGARAVYHYLPLDRSDRFPSLDKLDVLLLDETQRARRRERRAILRWLASGPKRFISATHRPWRPRGVARHELVLQPPRPQDVAAFFEHRIRLAGGDPRSFRLTGEALAWLATHAGSLRRVEQIMYEAMSSLSRRKPCSAPFTIGSDDVVAAMAKVSAATRYE